MTCIKAENISKGFNEKPVLKNISFSVEEGMLFGIFGPNASGKTTLTRILSTNLLPDTGKLTIDHLDAIDNYKQIRQRISYLPESPVLYHSLTVEENLSFFAGINNGDITKMKNLIEPLLLKLQPYYKTKSLELSYGIKKCIAFCCAVLNKSDLFIMDDPTHGMDEFCQNEAWKIIRHLNNLGKSILIATSNLHFINLFQDKIFIEKGEIKEKSAIESIYKIESFNQSELVLSLLKEKDGQN